MKISYHIAIIMTILLVSCNKRLVFPNAEAMTCDHSLEFPINDEEAAFCFAVSFDEVINSLKEMELKDNNIDGWGVRVEKTGDMTWHVGISSKGISPPFGCMVGFDIDGKELSRPHCLLIK